MPFSIAGIALDLDNVFPFLLKNNIDTHGMGVGATTLSPSSAVPRISLVVLVLLVGLALVGELLTKHVNKGKISGLSPFEVLFLLFSGPVPLETLGVNLMGT